MHRVSTTLLWAATGLLIVLLAGGCASSTQTLSSQDKARFGYVGMPMPPEAQKYMQQHATGTPPAVPQAKK